MGLLYVIIVIGLVLIGVLYGRERYVNIKLTKQKREKKGVLVLAVYADKSKRRKLMGELIQGLSVSIVGEFEDWCYQVDFENGARFIVCNPKDGIPKAEADLLVVAPDVSAEDVLNLVDAVKPLRTELFEEEDQ